MYYPRFRGAFLCAIREDQATGQNVTSAKFVGPHQTAVWIVNTIGGGVSPFWMNDNGCELRQRTPRHNELPSDALCS